MGAERFPEALQDPGSGLEQLKLKDSIAIFSSGREVPEANRKRRSLSLQTDSSLVDVAFPQNS